MDRVVKARLFGGAALAGAVLLAWRAEWAASLGLAAMGAAVVLLVTEREVPHELPARGSEGAQAALAHMLREMRVQGHGIVLPGATSAEPSRLYVPAHPEARRAPAAQDVADSIVVLRSASAATGLVLPPPGAGLEGTWRGLCGLPEGRGAVEAADHLRRALPALGLGQDVTVAHAPKVLRLSYRPHAFASACEASRLAQAPLHVQAGCPACSFAAILAARALGTPLRIRDAGAEGEKAYLELEAAQA